MTQPSPTPGWFPDPSDAGRLRYFDGRTWTDQYANVGQAAPAVVQAPAKGMPRGVKVALAIGAIVLGFGACSSLAGNDKRTETKSSSSTSTASAADSSMSVEDVPAPAGSSVRDGKFEFRVIGTSRGETSMEDTFGTEHAKGEFFVVRLEVTNIGDDARSFSATNQKLIINGNEYKATSFLNDSSWSDDINPGLGTTGQVVFDIPKGAVPTAIECHDSMFSGGALLAL